MALEAEETDSLSNMLSLKDIWTELLKSSREDSFFLSVPWMKTWWDVFGSDYKLKCITVEEEGEIVGIGPFAVSSRGRVMPWRKVLFIGTGPSDRCGIIAKDGRSDIHMAIWNYLKSTNNWDVIELRDMVSAQPTFTNVQLAFPDAECITSLSPHIDVSCGYAEYMAGLSKNMRYNIGRSKRKIEAAGGQFTSRKGAEGCRDGIKMLQKLSDARWEGDNVLKLPNMMKFAEKVSEIHSELGETVFHSIDVKGKPIAISMGFEDENRYMYYLSGFDPEYAKMSPGYVLISEIIHECCTNKLKEVDMLRGTEGYKYRFNAVDRMQYIMRAVNKGAIRNIESRFREEPLSL